MWLLHVITRDCRSAQSVPWYNILSFKFFDLHATAFCGDYSFTFTIFYFHSIPEPSTNPHYATYSPLVSLIIKLLRSCWETNLHFLFNDSSLEMLIIRESENHFVAPQFYFDSCLVLFFLLKLDEILCNNIAHKECFDRSSIIAVFALLFVALVKHNQTMPPVMQISVALAQYF